MRTEQPLPPHNGKPANPLSRTLITQVIWASSPEVRNFSPFIPLQP
jgi:hypothetical protein